jgi:nitrogen fixation protein FixH
MIVLGLFMASVLAVNAAFVWVSSTGRRDLVRSEFYAASLKQDSVLALEEAAVPFSLRRDGNDWLVENAAGGKGEKAATGCRLRFYRPDDGGADREIRLAPASAAAGKEAWRGPSPALRHGRWIVTAVWEHAGKDFREASLALTEP